MKVRQKSTSPPPNEVEMEDPPMITRSGTGDRSSNVFSKFKASKQNDLFPDLLLPNHNG